MYIRTHNQGCISMYNDETILHPTEERCLHCYTKCGPAISLLFDYVVKQFKWHCRIMTGMWESLWNSYIAVVSIKEESVSDYGSLQVTITAKIFCKIWHFSTIIGRKTFWSEVEFSLWLQTHKCIHNLTPLVDTLNDLLPYVMSSKNCQTAF